MGTQSDAVANARRGSGTALLVWPIRLSRNVPVGPGAGCRSPPPLSSNAQRAGNRRGSSCGRSGVLRNARALCGPARPRTGFGDQCGRSRRDRAWGWAVEHLCILRASPSIMDPVHLLGSRRHPTTSSGPRCVQRRARRSVVVAAGRGTVSALCRDYGALDTAAHQTERPAACGSPRLVCHAELGSLAVAHVVQGIGGLPGCGRHPA